MTEQNGIRRERVNATKRLHAFLAAVERTNPNVTTPLIDVMAAALGLPENKGGEADCQVLALLIDLLSRSESEIRNYLPNDLEFCLRSFEPLYRFFGPRTCNSAWNGFRAQLREKYIADVENTGQRLSGLVPEVSLVEADFSDVRDAMEELWSALSETHVSDDVRAVISRRFKDLEQSINDYIRVGAPGIKEAYENAVGAILADNRVRVELRRDEAAGGALAKAIKRVGIATLWLLGTANTVHDAQKNFAPFVHQLFLEMPVEQPGHPHDSAAHDPGVFLATREQLSEPHSELDKTS